MKRGGKLIACGFMAALLVLAVTLVVVAADQQPPESVTIKAGIWPSPTKAAVQYPHKKHAEEMKIACTECHHLMKDGKNVWKQGDPVKKCETCHTEPTIEGEKNLSPDQQKINLKLAYHENCQGCHKAEKKNKPDTKAPIVCTGCHPGEKK